MKKLSFLIFYITLLLSSYKINAQNYLIEYSESMLSNANVNMILTISDTMSWYRKAGDNSAKDELFVKNYNQKFLYYELPFYGKSYFIKDTLHNTSWSLTSPQKTILGYNCNSAKTFFRGRHYTAYYTSQIPISDGPWKYGGLPGLILEIGSDDKFKTITLIKISKTETKPKKLFNLGKYSFISWPEYKQIYKKTYDNLIQMEKTDPENIRINASGSLKIEKVESIYKELEEGDGLSY